MSETCAICNGPPPVASPMPFGSVWLADGVCSPDCASVMRRRRAAMKIQRRPMARSVPVVQMDIEIRR